ncbi:MAG: phosphoribosylglycinamide formyltransferase [Chloroflexi bacterium]|nr:phosphoribosylglycinamide formyltransferase [Chloroflexota bacterium]
MPDLCRVAVLISGRGSNLLALIEAIERGDVPAEIVLVAANRPDAGGLEYARGRAIPTLVADRARFPKRAARQERIRAALLASDIDLVVCAGFDEILQPSIVGDFSGRMLNVHPSLLPAFGQTLHAQAEALAYGAKVSGCTVHLVTDDLDAGPIILQRAVPILEDDTVESLSARILAEEHQALPEAVRLFAEGRLTLDGRCVRILA